MLDWMFFTSDQEPGAQMPVLVVYDLSTGAVMTMQSAKDSSVETGGAVVQTLETWGHTDVVLHADGEPATKSLVKAVANARSAQDPAEARANLQPPKPGAGRGLYRGQSWHLRGEQVGSGGGNRIVWCLDWQAGID